MCNTDWFRLLHLKRKVEGQKEGHLSFLKTNVGAVMDQVDTLILLKERYGTDLDEFGSEPTLKLEKAIKGINNFDFIANLMILFQNRKGRLGSYTMMF